MKRSMYQLWEKISNNCFLHYSSLSNSFLILNQNKHELYCQVANIDSLILIDSKLFETLKSGKFIIPDDFNEKTYVLEQKQKMINNTSLYNIVINTTLDCNLNCWYCYETKIKGSHITQETIKAIKQNIVLTYNEQHYSVLKLSFFGGEPFLFFEGIKDILLFAKEYCTTNSIELIADFTTNATINSDKHIDFLKDFRCHFQITLDGGRNTHNKVKIDQNGILDTYQKTIDVLNEINKNINNRWVAIRINFDNRTLAEIGDIISDLNFMDRKKCYVIIKKVWQLKTNLVDKKLLINAIQSFFNQGFLVDYYYMPKGCVCFAERKNQVLFNYDGKIFKCTTISSFDDNNALGQLNFSTGAIHWHKGKITDWYKELQPEYCKNCVWFPSCLGICNRQLLAHQGEHICTFDAFNLTRKEYLMYLFKYNILQNEISY